jgi:hypothetical protein
MRKGAIMSSGKTESSTKSSESFISSYGYLTEQEKQINDDYEWCLHDPEVRRQYGDQVVAVHQRRIWGVGKDHLAALNAALQQPGCPQYCSARFLLAAVYNKGNGSESVVEPLAHYSFP